jgi:hypothetical protein
MASALALALVLVTTAPPPEAPEMRHTVHRNAAILTGVAATALLGGATILGFGIHDQHTGTVTGGAALIGVGVTVLVIAIFAWLWPGPFPPWHASR